MSHASTYSMDIWQETISREFLDYNPEPLLNIKQYHLLRSLTSYGLRVILIQDGISHCDAVTSKFNHFKIIIFITESDNALLWNVVMTRNFCNPTALFNPLFTISIIGQGAPHFLWSITSACISVKC